MPAGFWILWWLKEREALGGGVLWCAGYWIFLHSWGVIFSGYKDYLTNTPDSLVKCCAVKLLVF